ncbi:MAG: hypothetical protein WDA27_14530 [Actinomycetota bacterium]
MSQLLTAEGSLKVYPAGGESAWGILAVVALVAWLVIAVSAGKDMSDRGQRGGLWTLLVLVAPPVGILLWAALRSNWPKLLKDSGAGYG